VTKTWSEQNSSKAKELKERVAQDLEEAKRRAKLRAKTLLQKLMRGERLTAEEGREIVWRCMVNGDVMHLDPYTGNAKTYFNCGLKKNTERWIRHIKFEMDLFEEYQEMEREAYSRSKREDKSQ
jgi:hypothetical protein